MKTTLNPIWVLLVMAGLVAAPTASDADRGRPVSALCRKLTSCRLVSYEPCMKVFGNAPGADDPDTFAQARLSCQALADQLAPSQWLCTAEGASSYGYDMDGNLPDEQGSSGIFMMGTGPTRAAAVYKAISDCNAIMSFQLNHQYTLRDDTRWGAEITRKCHITQCIAPVSARRQR